MHVMEQYISLPATELKDNVMTTQKETSGDVPAVNGKTTTHDVQSVTDVSSRSLASADPNTIPSSSKQDQDPQLQQLEVSSLRTNYSGNTT